MVGCDFELIATFGFQKEKSTEAGHDITNMSRQLTVRFCCGRWEKEAFVFVELDVSCCELGLVCDQVSHFVFCRISSEFPGKIW